ncbi:YgfZ/GcvT domain-containing protein [Bogoriella caseilytica]|uniref:Uncharacterized protein n=1 Tax=Bogoriella caseilytica TaxID=56055 RepID=A0A3N2BB84_9MICO|nr:folate-binding protein YgfZ [Bogoriella caseilytica]ROR72488.1 hypothetical protein EDD31_0839 [Bogoriella caseilytica]
MGSPLLTTTGAVEAGAPDAGVALHYGDPVREQRALARGDGLVDLSHLGVVTIAGADRITWLNTLSSQLLLDLAPGVSSEVLLLDVHGHIEHAPAVQDDGETLWLITEAASAEPLAAFLDSMRFTLRVEVARREDVAVLGTHAGGWSRLTDHEAHLLTWQDPWPRVGAGSTSYGPEEAEHPGIEFHRAFSLVRREALTAVVAAAQQDGARLAGVWAWEALRIEARRPRVAREVDERTIPHELDWLRTAVHLDKGCYRGQETVARVVNLGKPPRRLVFLHLDGSDHLLPEAGAEVTLGERTVGKLTSVARHEELGPIGLALIKRNVDPEAELSVSGIAAAQEVVVRPDGVTDVRPAERPGAGLRRRTI